MSANYIPTHKDYSRNGEILESTPWPEGMQRVALGVEYLGADFHGFQTQPSGVKTVQQALEKALSKVADEPITLVCAGRTDAGVHATNQVVHFDTMAKRPAKAWVRGTRPHLPDAVTIKWAQEVAPQFHARFSAQQRTYRYLLSDAPCPTAHFFKQITWHHRPLNVDLMREAAQYLVGEHDFTSFRATQCQAKSPVRTINHLHLVRRGDLIILEVQANAFLHHMVRNIVGVLLTIGMGDKPISWIVDILNARDRTKGGDTAKPTGLYLVDVGYPDCFMLPDAMPGPLFLADAVGQLK